MENTSWMDKPPYRTVRSQETATIPKGFWEKCGRCGDQITTEEFKKNNFICIKCGFHGQMPFQDRIKLLTDENSFKEKFSQYKSINPLNYSDDKITYQEKLLDSFKKTGSHDAVVVGLAKMNSLPIVFGTMVFKFIGGSMGSVVGEKIYRAMELAIKKKQPFVLVCASGGARMQEGLLSLVQMAKTSMGVQKMNEKRIPLITVLTHPTMGGVTASFASLGDVIIAEPNAIIGFAGRRVIEGMIKTDLPKEFQTAEYLFDRGFIDLVIHRNQLKEKITAILNHLS